MTDYRLFIAIELPAPAKSALETVQKSLHALHAVRWTKPAQIHLTVQFLGDTPAELVPKLSAALAETVSALSPFMLSLAKVGAFPNLKRPRIIWVGVGAIPALTDLHRAVTIATESVGIADKKPFNPHLTIGRVQKWARGNDFRAIAATVSRAKIGDIATFRVDRISLIRSELTRQGPIYAPKTTLTFSKPSFDPTDVM